MRHVWSFAAGLAVVVGGALEGAAPAATPHRRIVATSSAKASALLPLTIATAHGRRRFRIEVARTEAEQARGLMFRKVVAEGTGMLFPMYPPRPASFWMKNTYVPLDMLFIRADGTIARIAANTVPLSLFTVESGEPVAAVLEIAGGAAARQGIVEGDRVRWPGAPAGG